MPRLSEQILYALVSFLPYLPLALYPFRRNLRYAPPVTAALGAGLVLLRIGMWLWFSVSRYPGAVSMLGTVLYGLFYCLAVRDHPGKTVFTLLMLTNLANFILSASKCLEGLLFPDLAVQAFRWSCSATMVGIELLVLIPMFFYLKHSFQEALHCGSSGGAWRYLWLIPLTFYAVWFRNFFFSQEGARVLALRPRHLLYSAVINGGALLIYAMVARFLREQAQNEILRERQHMLMLQRSQYETLNERIEEARRASHDIRHHLRVFSAYLEDGKLEELRTHLRRYADTIPDDTRISYCDHYAVNALLMYFTWQTEVAGVDYEVCVDLPTRVEIPDEDLTVVLGNLIENALTASAQEAQGPKRIQIRGRLDDSAVFFRISNTCTRPLKKNRAGQFITTKPGGKGIGLASVKNIAEKYEGILEVTQQNGIVTVSIMLNLPE